MLAVKPVGEGPEGQQRQRGDFHPRRYSVLKGAGRRGKTMLVRVSHAESSANLAEHVVMPMINIKQYLGLLTYGRDGRCARGAFSVCAPAGRHCRVIGCSRRNNDPALVAQELAPHRVAGNMTDILTVTVEDYPPGGIRERQTA